MVVAKKNLLDFSIVLKYVDLDNVDISVCYFCLNLAMLHSFHKLLRYVQYHQQKYYSNCNKFNIFNNPFSSI